MPNRLDALKARMVMWKRSPILTRVHVPVSVPDIERLVAVVEAAHKVILHARDFELSSYRPPDVGPLADALAYWLELEEQK